MRHLKSAIFYCVYLILAISALVVLIEAILAIGFVLTGKSAFDTLIEKDIHPYPDNPADYLKISIFGGSAAAGWASERGFAQIIEYELRKAYPNVKFFVRNYAQPGATFHRGQAKLLRSAIDKYDIFLVYAGNNEGTCYLRDTSGSTTPADESQTWGMAVTFLKKYSRLYAVSAKMSRRYVGPLLTRTAFLKGTSGRCSARRKFKLFEEAAAVPWDERTKITAHFQKDLDEIAQLVQKKRKYLIISSVPTNEDYKPLFSVLSPTLECKERDLFYEYYNRGMEQWGRGEFQEALKSFSRASLIDDKVAIVHYMIGKLHLILGNSKEGRKYLQKATDYDGFLARALNGYWTAAKLVADKYSNAYYVDSLEAFHTAVDEGVGYKALFSDLNHPSLMGHVIIANRFLCKICQLPPLRKYSGQQMRLDLPPSELRSLVKRYREALGVTQQDDSVVALQISRMHLAYSLSFSNSKDYLPTAETSILRFYAKSKRTRDTRAKMCIFRALIELERKNKTKALEYSNEALALSPFTVWQIMVEPLISGELPFHVFRRAGIGYSQTENRFMMQHDAP